MPPIAGGFPEALIAGGIALTVGFGGRTVMTVKLSTFEVGEVVTPSVACAVTRCAPSGQAPPGAGHDHAHIAMPQFSCAGVTVHSTLVPS